LSVEIFSKSEPLIKLASNLANKGLERYSGLDGFANENAAPKRESFFLFKLMARNCKKDPETSRYGEPLFLLV